MFSRVPFRSVALVFAFIFMLAALNGATSIATSNQNQLDSGAIGLTRDQIEAVWGPSTDAIDQPGHPGSDEMYAYTAIDTMAYVSYRETNGEQIAVYVEFTWLGDGVSQEVSTRTVESLLPSDAELTELYLAPPTPSGPIALSLYRYTSEALAQAYDSVLAPEILVIEQHAWNEAAGASTITSFSMMIRERTQLTG